MQHNNKPLDDNSDVIQCIIDRAVLDAQEHERKPSMKNFNQKDKDTLRAERLSICKEVVPILIATCNPHKRIPSRIAEDAVEYADALIRELDK